MLVGSFKFDSFRLIGLDVRPQDPEGGDCIDVGLPGDRFHGRGGVLSKLSLGTLGVYHYVVVLSRGEDTKRSLGPVASKG